jgi:hypothetical protein
MTTSTLENQEIQTGNLYHPEEHFVESRYVGFLKAEKFQANAKGNLECVQKHNCHRMLVNLSKLGVMTKENQVYIQEHWFPNAMKTPLKRIAFLVPDNVFGETSMKSANRDENSLPFDVHYFYEREQAVKWLLSE